jgi:hypothetical protein
MPNMPNNRIRTGWLLLAVGGMASAAAAAPALEGRTVATDRLRIALAPSGLPEQIAIQPAEEELPLEVRGKLGEIPPGLLRAIGRGAQLRGPIRLEATIDGKNIPAEVAKAAAPQLADGRVTGGSEVRFGPLTAQWQVSYGSADLQADLTLAGGAEVDELALVIEIAGPVDTVVPVALPIAKLEPAPPDLFLPAPGEGVVWANGAAPGTPPGVVRHVFVGSGDRGWTWLCDDKEGWPVDRKAPTMTLTRDAAGAITWRVLFVNRRTGVKDGTTLRFALLTHPARTAPADDRRQAWLKWPAPTNTTATPTVSRQALVAPAIPADAVLRADTATAYEALCPYAVLSGPAGGDAISLQQDHVSLYPIPFFRYLAGTHTGQVRRLLPNAARLISPGAERRLDRSLIARCLLHDIGLDAAGLAHLADAATVVKALHAFGCFEPDGATEFIPYWRTARILRYGEVFVEGDAFALDAEDPVGRVYVSVYRRPVRPGAPQTRTLILIANEGDQPVRDQLYVLDPLRLFGGGNRLTDADVVGSYDFSNLPDDSDWGKPGVLSNRYKSSAVLKDMEDNGTVRLVADKDGMEVYGPHIFVPARGFRLLYGTGGRP